MRRNHRVSEKLKTALLKVCNVRVEFGYFIDRFAIRMKTCHRNSFVRSAFLAALFLVLGTFVTAPLIFAQSLTFQVFAGPGGGSGFFDGTGSAARFRGPNGVAVDTAGNVYVVDTGNETIRKITAAGEVTTLAGRAGSFGHVNGTGSAARFLGSEGVAADADGNVYVADTFNNAIRRISAAGVVSTLAGGSYGYADGSGRAASFQHPRAVAIDSSGNILVADSGNSAIRKITPQGVVTTLAGGNCCFPTIVGEANSLALDSAGNIYIADRHSILKLTPSGVVTSLAGSGMGFADGIGNQAKFGYTTGVATDRDGNVYVADSSNHAIRKITPAGVVTTLAGFPPYGLGSTDGVGSAARFGNPQGVAVDSAGNVYVADTFNSTIRKITPSAVVTTIAGLAASAGGVDGIAAAARFSGPLGVATDPDGNVYVAESYNFTIRKITPAGMVSTLAGKAGYNGSVDGEGGAARFGGYWGGPEAVASDHSGNVYVADTHNHTIRKITPDGLVTTLAGSAGLRGSANGVGAAARFDSPQGVATDRLGNIYVADSIDNNIIRKISADGNVSTFARIVNRGLAGDSHGKLYVADGNTIQIIAPDGVVTTLAGKAGFPGEADGTGSAARFNGVRWLTTDSEGNVFTTEDDRIRKITPAGVVTTVAGIFGVKGNAEGTGNAARFSGAAGIATYGGYVYVADFFGSRILRGESALPDVAVIDSPLGPAFQKRQLDTAPQTATAWNWAVVRRPANSTAVLSSAFVRNPTFRPDVADLYVFRLTATNGTLTSITTVELAVTPGTGRSRPIRR